MGFSRDDMEDAFLTYWRTGAVGEDWNAWADLNGDPSSSDANHSPASRSEAGAADAGRNLARAFSLFALANLYLVRRQLLPPQVRCVL